MPTPAAAKQRFPRRLTMQELEPVLAVTRHLAARFDLKTVLLEVVNAAKQVLQADRCSVWLYDPVTDELALNVALDLNAVRVKAGVGFVGTCARDRTIINVPDCYADPRFNTALDAQTNYHTRCMLTMPLIDHDDALVGVMQVLNKNEGVFDQDDETLATVLAAQCAVALQRARMFEAMIDGERMRHQLDLARGVQLGTLPAEMPKVPGYDLYGMFQPADQTGGDTFDLANLGDEVLVVLGDATGHGLAPALHITQMHAMLRMAFRMGGTLEAAFIEVNNQLAEVLPEDRFVTAFIGLLDPRTHRLEFHSAGQAPILLFRAAELRWELFQPTSFPLAAMPLRTLRQSIKLDLAPGDLLVLLSDGIYEYHDSHGEMFGIDRVKQVIETFCAQSCREVADHLLAAVKTFAAGAVQDDDITVVLVKRDAGLERTLAIARRTEALADVFAFTAKAIEDWALAEAVHHVVDFTIEELFTNMVKYGGPSRADVLMTLRALPEGVEVRLVDRDVDPFDPTEAPDANVNLSIDDRVPGGLGLHLIRRLTDSMEYTYDAGSRTATTVFTKRAGGTGSPMPGVETC